VSVRSICAGRHHPDHDTICDFRVRNETAIAEAFLLRGLSKVNLEWQLVNCAYNLKRLARILA